MPDGDPRLRLPVVQERPRLEQDARDEKPAQDEEQPDTDAAEVHGLTCRPPEVVQEHQPHGNSSERVQLRHVAQWRRGRPDRLADGRPALLKGHGTLHQVSRLLAGPGEYAAARRAEECADPEDVRDGIVHSPSRVDALGGARAEGQPGIMVASTCTTWQVRFVRRGGRGPRT